MSELLAAAAGLRVRDMGRVDYAPTWHAMQAFTAGRGADAADELWLVEHPPVFTLGLAGLSEHLIGQTDIPVVKIDRGGQITYHGPGQAVVYLLIDLARRGLKVRELVNLMEEALIRMLAAIRGFCVTARVSSPRRVRFMMKRNRARNSRARMKIAIRI